MKFVIFPEASHHAGDFHYYRTAEGLVVMALELDKKDIKALRSGDKLFVIAGPGLQAPPPLQLTLANPFAPITKTGNDFINEVKPVMTVSNETTDPESTRNNQQPAKSNNKFSE
jgi:hypothetical protein